MRRIVTAITAAALALSLVAQSTPAAALVAGYDSLYAGESTFLTLRPGETGSFTVFFQNKGATTWVKGTATQVDLFACLNDKVTCDVAPEEAAWNPGTWLSTTRYATHVQASVPTDSVATFTYNVVVPAGTAPGEYDFNGDLGVSSLSGSAARIHPEGYFQRVTVPTAPPAATTGIVTEPTTAATNQTSTAAGTTANRGARSYTVTVTGLTGCVDIALITQARASADGTRFRDTAGGTPGSTAVQDNRADNLGETSAVIEVINGVARATAGGTTAASDDYADCVAIPTNGIITFTIDSSVAGQDVKPIVFQDANNNDALDLTGTADASGFRTPSETFSIGGRKTYIAGAADATADAAAGSVCRKDAAGNSFSLNNDLVPDPSPTAAECDVTYFYDSNDQFFVEGIPVGIDTFEAELSRGDTVNPGAYSTETAGQSSFNITLNAPTAPAVTCTVVASDDVKLSIDPAQPEYDTAVTNTYSNFVIQRRPSGGTFSTIATSTVDEDANTTTVWEYTDKDLAAGTYEYRVRGTVDGDTGDNTAVSCSATTTTPGAATPAPVSNDLFISTSAGLTSQLDTGDVFKVVFSEAMNPDSTGDVIQVQDADGTTMTIRCTDVGVVTGEYTAACQFNSAAVETVKGASQAINTVLTVAIKSMSLPTATGQAGTVAGMQLPTTVIDQGGITDLTGDQWNVIGSPDRVVDIE